MATHFISDNITPDDYKTLVKNIGKLTLSNHTVSPGLTNALNQVAINQNDIKDLKTNGIGSGSGGGSGSITGIFYSTTNDELQVSKKIQSTQSIFSPNITHNTNMVSSNNLAITNNTNSINTNTSNLQNFTLSTVNNISNNTNSINQNSTSITTNQTNISNNSTSIQNNTTAISNLQSASNSSTFSNFTTQNLPLNNQQGSIVFNTTINKPVYFNDGKWYNFSDVELKDNTLDLYIFAGQSNMDGQASTSGVPTTDRTDAIFYKETASDFNSVIDGNWSGLTLGQTSFHASNLFGPEIGFHDRTKLIPSHYEQPIAILKFARGATDLARDWNTTDSNNYLFDKFKEALDDGRNKLTSTGYSFNIKGFVFFQGEGDTLSSTDAGNYQTNLTNFISAIRTHLVEPNLPIVICSIDRASEPSNSLTVRTAQQSVASGDVNIYYVPTESYSRKSDGVHLNTQGMLDTGEAVANALAGISGVFNVLNYFPLVWYDALNGTDMTIDVNTNKISKWNDKSNNNRHITQSNTNNQPTYSNNELQLNGSQYLFNTLPFMYDNGSMEVFIVASGLAQSDTRLIGEGSSTNNSPFYGIQSGQAVQQGGSIGDIQKMSAFIRNDNSSTLVSGTLNNGVAFDGSFKILHWKDTGTQLQGRINGGSFGFISYTRSGSFSVNRFCIGGVLRSSFSSGFTGSIKEIIITPLNTNTDREKLEGYLSHKWGLENDLPSTHPYKTSAP